VGFGFSPWWQVRGRSPVLHCYAPLVCCPFPTKQRRHTMERVDLTRRRKPHPLERAVSEDRLGHLEPCTAPRGRVPEGHLVSMPPFVSPRVCYKAKRRVRYGAHCLCWAREPFGSASRTYRLTFIRSLLTNKHSSFSPLQAPSCFFSGITHTHTHHCNRALLQWY
jgi:hypothetical protein